MKIIKWEKASQQMCYAGFSYFGTRHITHFDISYKLFINKTSVNLDIIEIYA